MGLYGHGYGLECNNPCPTHTCYMGLMGQPHDHMTMSWSFWIAPHVIAVLAQVVMAGLRYHILLILEYINVLSLIPTCLSLMV